jgi:hypothetical protein
MKWTLRTNRSSFAMNQCGLGLFGSRDGSRKLRPVGMLAALDFAELGLKRPTAVGKVHRLRRHASPWRAGVCGTRTEQAVAPARWWPCASLSAGFTVPPKVARQKIA